MSSTYKICNRCVMDTTDPEIQFDENGYCNHCTGYYNIISKKVFRGEDGRKKLETLVQNIKDAGQGQGYDCLLGLSGGVDSSYIALKIKEMGLRPLCVHLDNGWNSETSVRNIQKLVEKLGSDLQTYVINWEEFRDLQLSFLKSGVPNLEIPTDHAFVAALYSLADKFKKRYIISGHNAVTEAILPRAWGHDARDLKHIHDIQERFGAIALKTFPRISYLKLWYYTRIKKIKVVRLLNFMEYDREKAKKYLEEQVQWHDYGAKHCESIFTKFFQEYILPKRYGYDKRRAHLSCLVCAGQMKRDDAVRILKENPYPSEENSRNDKKYVIKKLGLTDSDFEAMINMPRIPHERYKIDKRYVSCSSK